MGSNIKRIVEYDFLNDRRLGPRSAIFHVTTPEGRVETYEEKVLFEKILEESDVIGRNNLRIKETWQVFMDSLSDEDKRMLERRGFLALITRAPSLNYYTLLFRHSADTGVAEISGEWPDLVSDNRLKKGDAVHGWGSRQSNGHIGITLKITRRG